MDDGSASAAIDRAADAQETADTSGTPDTTNRVAARIGNDTRAGAHLTANISDIPDTIDPVSTPVGADHGAVERVARDISGKTDATPRRTPFDLTSNTARRPENTECFGRYRYDGLSARRYFGKHRYDGGKRDRRRHSPTARAPLSGSRTLRDYTSPVALPSRRP